jgi:antitoxin YefM
MYPEITLTEAAANLSHLCEQVINNREVILLTREEGENVAMIPANELEQILKLTNLFNSFQKNSTLLNKLPETNDDESVKHQTVEELLDELGLGNV